MFAYNANGKAMSNIVLAEKPAAPSDLTGSQPTAADPVALFWTDNAPNMQSLPNYVVDQGICPEKTQRCYGLGDYSDNGCESGYRNDELR